MFFVRKIYIYYKSISDSNNRVLFDYTCIYLITYLFPITNKYKYVQIINLYRIIIPSFLHPFRATGHIYLFSNIYFAFAILKSQIKRVIRANKIDGLTDGLTDGLSDIKYVFTIKNLFIHVNQSQIFNYDGRWTWRGWSHDKFLCK